MKKVLVFGTFDVIHAGHLSFLRQARAEGDYIIASVARDEYVRKTKGREPVHSEKQRLAHLLEAELVDEAHLSDPVPGTYSIVSRFRPDTVCFGHDQNRLRDNLEAWLAAKRIKLPTRTLSAYKPEKYKSSKLNPTRTAADRRKRGEEP